MSTAFSQCDTVQVTCQEPSEEVLAQLIREVRARASLLKGKEAVNLAWAFSKMQAQFHAAEDGQ